MKNWEKDFFEMVPMNVAIIDREFNIVQANQKFKNTFGDWEEKKCFEVCKQSDKICSYCKAKIAFLSGEPFFSHETGKNKEGKDYHYVVEFVPIFDDKGKVSHIIEISSDILKSTSFNSEYNILFESVPTYVTIIDRNYNLIKVNKKFRDTFGDAKGRPCYEIYKKRNSMCKHCPASLTFSDGYEHSSTQTGLTFAGDDTHYVVSSTPLAHDENGVSLVIEIATDISEITRLQNQLIESQEFYSEIIKYSCEGIIAVNDKNKIQVFNKAARDILDWKSRKKPGYTQIKEVLPDNFFSWKRNEEVISESEETAVHNYHGKPIVVDFNKMNIKKGRDTVGKVAFFRDIQKNKALEKENLSLYRYASIGRTLNHLRLVGSSLSESIRSDLMRLKQIDDKLGNIELNKTVEDLMFKFGRLSGYMKGMMGLPKIELEGVKLKSPIDFFEKFKIKFESAFTKAGIGFSFNADKKISALPIDFDKLEELLKEFLLKMNKIGTSEKYGKLNTAVVLDENEGITEIRIETDYVYDETFRDVVTTDMSFINLYVSVASYGGVVDIKELEKKLVFSFFFDKEKIMKILAEVKA